MNTETTETVIKRKSYHTVEKPIQNSPFTDEEIIAANERHDREYGWSIKEPRIYTNPSRLVTCYKIVPCGKKS